jgi:hypothetical protein
MHYRYDSSSLNRSGWREADGWRERETSAEVAGSRKFRRQNDFVHCSAQRKPAKLLGGLGRKACRIRGMRPLERLPADVVFP